MSISNPSQTFFKVITVAPFRPDIIFFSVDCVIPQIVPNLLIVNFRCWHNSKIRSLTAVVIFILNYLLTASI